MQKEDTTPIFTYADDMPAKPLRYGATQAKRRIEAAQRGEHFYNTGIGTIDQYVRFRPATYSVVAAESGAGKTAMSLQIAERIEAQKAERGDDRATLIFSAEMASAELVQRMAAARTKISIWEMESGRLTDDQVGRLFDTIDDISANIPFQIDEADSPDRDHIFRSCEIINEAYGLSMVIFDYIELATTDERFKAEHVRSVAKTLKNVARQYDIPVIGVSQVNKDNKARANKKPEMTDLRYGGHEPADMVMILQELSPEAFTVIVPDDFKAIKAWVVKNRAGRKDVSCDLMFHGETMTFHAGQFQEEGLNE